MQRLLIIDSSNIFYHNAQSREKGHIVLKILKTYTDILLKFSPHKVVNVLDIGKSKHRLKIFPDYKAQRILTKSKLEEEQVLLARNFRSNANLFLENIFYNVGIKDIEADDIINFFYKKYRQEFDIIIVSLDRDLLQICGSIYDFKQNKFITIDSYGITLSQFIYYKAFLGDISDNIAGIKRCGEVTAKYLFRKYETVNKMFHTDPETEVNPFAKAVLKKLKEKEIQSLVKRNLSLMRSLQEEMLSEVDNKTLQTALEGFSKYQPTFPSPKCFEALEEAYGVFGLESLYEIILILQGVKDVTTIR